MPLFLQDRQLGYFYGRLETGHATDPKVHISEDNLIEMLAAIADSPTKSAARAKSELYAAPNRQAMLLLVQTNMNRFEKGDIARILDTPEAQRVPIDESVRNFLAAVLGREPLADGPSGGGGGTPANG